MTFAIDAGNTRIKLGIFQNDMLVETYALERFAENEPPANTHPALEEILLHALHEAAHKVGENFTKGIVSSVTEHDARLFGALSDKFPGLVLTLDHTTALPFKNNYETPQTLGTDRLAVMVGALSVHPSEPCLVINAGTAITFDYLTKNEVYTGGAISPGEQMRFKALHTFTSRLPLIKAETGLLPAYNSRNTADCIRSGVTLGILHEIAGTVNAWRQRSPANVHAMLCGGDSMWFATQLKSSIFAVQIEWQPDLVLLGLNSILTFNDV